MGRGDRVQLKQHEGSLLTATQSTKALTDTVTLVEAPVFPVNSHFDARRVEVHPHIINIGRRGRDTRALRHASVLAQPASRSQEQDAHGGGPPHHGDAGG